MGHARRITLGRLVLLAWLAFAVSASLLPFLFVADLTIIGSRPSFDTIDVDVEGGAITVKPGIWRSLNGGIFQPSLGWRPSTTNWLRMGLSSTQIRQRQFWRLQFSPWLIVLAPTLLGMGTFYAQCSRSRRKIAATATTRCAACGYDTTGLTMCPECGVGVEGSALQSTDAT